MTDVILDDGPDGQTIVLQARYIHCDGVSDLLLHAPFRDNGNKSPHRALIHDGNDTLTINGFDDYSGGVQINGKGGVQINGHALSIKGSDLTLDDLERRPDTNPGESRRALVHNFTDGLTINWNGDYRGGVVLHGNLSVVGTLFVDDVVLRTKTGAFQLNPDRPNPPFEPRDFPPSAPSPGPGPTLPHTPPGPGDTSNSDATSNPNAPQDDVLGLQREISSLQEQITALQAAVKSLQQSAKGA